MADNHSTDHLPVIGGSFQRDHDDDHDLDSIRKKRSNQAWARVSIDPKISINGNHNPKLRESRTPPMAETGRSVLFSTSFWFPKKTMKTSHWSSLTVCGKSLISGESKTGEARENYPALHEPCSKLLWAMVMFFFVVVKDPKWMFIPFSPQRNRSTTAMSSEPRSREGLVMDRHEGVDITVELGKRLWIESAPKRTKSIGDQQAKLPKMGQHQS